LLLGEADVEVAAERGRPGAAGARVAGSSRQGAVVWPRPSSSLDDPLVLGFATTLLLPSPLPY
jgi:hypothetical protein